MNEYLKALRDSNIVEKMTSEQALKLAVEGGAEDHTGFDAAEAERLGLIMGQTICVTPTDTGRFTLALAS